MTVQAGWQPRRGDGCHCGVRPGFLPATSLILRGGPLLQVKKAGLRVAHRWNLDLHSYLRFQSCFEEGEGEAGCGLRACLHRLAGLPACAGHLGLETLHSSWHTAASSSPQSHLLQPLLASPRNPAAYSPAAEGLGTAQVGPPGPCPWGRH